MNLKKRLNCVDIRFLIVGWANIMRDKKSDVLVFLLVSLFVWLGAGTAVAQDDPVAAAADWLIAAHQNEDGGYTAFSAGAGMAASDVGGTADALLALAGTGADVKPLLGFLTENGSDLAAYAGTGGSMAGKMILALTAAGQNPRDFAGVDLVAALDGQIGADGAINSFTAFEQSLAIMGLALAGEPIPETATAWLVNLQEMEGDLAGSWDDGYGTAGNPDATAMAIMALTLANAEPDAAAQGIDFLMQAQLETGGWEYGPGFGENVNSTALAAQALALAGQDVTDGLAALLSWQSETGAFQADFGSGRFDDFFSTVQALPALAAANRPTPALLGPPVIEEPTATPEPEPTAVPTEAPTDVPPTATLEPQPTTVPPTAVPAEPVAAEEPSGNTAVIAGVVGLLLVLAGAGFVYQRRRG